MTDAQIPILLFSILLCFFISLLAGKFIIPWLRAMKAGQSIREDGPQFYFLKVVLCQEENRIVIGVQSADTQIRSELAMVSQSRIYSAVSASLTRSTT